MAVAVQQVRRVIVARSGLRLLSLFVAFMTCLTALTARLIYVQGIDSQHFERLASTQRDRKLILSPQRGTIFDRDGGELAMSLDLQTLFLNPKLIADRKQTAAQLAPLLGQDAASLEAKLSKDASFIYLARKVDPEVAVKIKQLGIPGLGSVSESKRFYPAGSLASHLLGFVGSDNEGLGGLEGRYEKILKGAQGEMLIERDPQGRAIPAGKSFTRLPTSGDDLILTVDKQIQYEAETALAQAVVAYSAKGGTVVVMRPATGEILALANSPTFDPNDVAASTPEQRKNRGLVDVYEPGSANKVITAAAAIESGVVRPSDMFKVPDSFTLGSKTFHDAHPHPVETLSFSEIIEQSSNVGTIKVAQGLGKDRLYEYLTRFGYGKPTGLDFPGEAAGILPKPANWSGPSMGTIPIGQGVAVTALQIMSVYATVANGGVAVQPKLVRATIDGQGERKMTPASAKRRVITTSTATQVTQILLGVTEGKHGTGTMAAIPGYQVAGKTGTAQKPIPGGGGYSGYVGSFIGFAPAGDPQLVVGVILDDPSPIWGGVTAAPTFKQIMQFSLRRLGIGPGPVLPREGTPLPVPDRSGGAAPDQRTQPPATDGTAD